MKQNHSMTWRTGLLAGLSCLSLAACGGGRSEIEAEPPVARADTTDTGLPPVIADQPQPDSRGIVTYPDYQVALTRDGDTLEAVAARIGVSATDLGKYNGLPVNYRLRGGETLVIPPDTARRVVPAAPDTTVAGTGITETALPPVSPLSEPIPAGTVAATPEVAVVQPDVAPGTEPASPAPAAPGWSPELAASAIDRADSPGTVASPVVPGEETDTASLEPLRHNVTPGETIYSIARLYGVPVASVAAMNGLGRDYTLRPGQEIMIPIGQQTTTPPPAPSVPGEAAPIAAPPSAADPLPPPPPVVEIPPSPNLDQYRAEATPTRKLQRPVSGQIASRYARSGPNRNDGIDIVTDSGAQVLAADDGEVALISNSLGGLGKILLIRHDGGLTTVYGRVDSLTVQKGDRIVRGQVIGVVAPTSNPSLHFEVRKGAESVDPESYL